METKETLDQAKRFVLADYTMDQHQAMFREQQRRERNANIPMELRPYWALGEIAINVLTVPIEVLSRRHFGMRYLSTGRVITSILLYSFLVWAASIIFGRQERVTRGSGFWGTWQETQYHPDIPDMMVLFGILWVPAAIYNLWLIQQRRRQGIRWHNRSTGISYLEGRFPGSDWTHYRFWEPLGWLVIGVAFLLISMPLGLYLTAAAILMLVRNNQNYGDFVELIVIQNDMAIQAELMAGGARPGGKMANYGYEPVALDHDMSRSFAEFQGEVSVGATMNRLRKAAARVPHVFEDIGTVVSDVTGKRSEPSEPVRENDSKAATGITPVQPWEATKDDSQGEAA